MNKIKKLLQKLIAEIEKHEKKENHAIWPLKNSQYERLYKQGHMDIADKVNELVAKFNEFKDKHSH